MPARRSPWMDVRAALLVQVLQDEHGLSITEDVAREDVSNYVDDVAGLMRIGRQAAKRYVTDDAVRGLAGRIVEHIENHHDAIRNGSVADLAAKRRRRFPTPP